jgi:hypothetical protein
VGERSLRTLHVYGPKLVLTETRAKILWIKRVKRKLYELILKREASLLILGNSLKGLQWANLLVLHCEAEAFVEYLQLIESDAAMSKWVELMLDNYEEHSEQFTFGSPVGCRLHFPYIRYR